MPVPWLRHDPQVWPPGTLDRQGLQAESAALASSPGFASTARAFADGWLSTQDDNPALRAVLRNSARYSLLVLCLVLHHQRDRDDPRSGITPGRLLQMFERVSRKRIEAGPTQVKAILSHARAQGLLSPATGHLDARFRPLEPTVRLNHAMQQWVAAFLRPVQHTLPAPVDDLLAAPGLVGAVFACRIAAQERDGFVLTDDHPAMAWMMSRDRGYRLFLQLVRVMQVQPQGRATIELTQSELARRAGISRATVRSLLADLRDYGWIEAEGTAEGTAVAGSVETPISMDATHVALALQWIAREITWMRGLALAVWQRLGSG